jgi:cytochrome c553
VVDGATLTTSAGCFARGSPRPAGTGRAGDLDDYQRCAARRSHATCSRSRSTVKLRQTQAEYTAARPNAEPGVKPMMSSSKMYVCIRCHANFKTGDGKPDPRLRGLGRCNACLGVTAAPVR